MRILFAFPLLVVIGLILAGCEAQQKQPEQLKIAVVDMGSLMRDSAPGKAGVKYLEAMQAGMQKELDAIQDKIERNPDDEDAMRELQRIYASSQQRVQAESQNVINTLLNVVQRVLNNFREKNGYAVMIGSDAMASFDPKIDVTSQVMSELDKQEVKYQPLPENPLGQEPKAEESKAEAAEKPAEDRKAEPVDEKKDADQSSAEPARK